MSWLLYRCLNRLLYRDNDVFNLDWLWDLLRLFEVEVIAEKRFSLYTLGCSVGSGDAVN